MPVFSTFPHRFYLLTTFSYCFRLSDTLPLCLKFSSMAGFLALIFLTPLQLRVELSEDVKHSQLLVIWGQVGQFSVNHGKNKTKNSLSHHTIGIEQQSIDATWINFDTRMSSFTSPTLRTGWFTEECLYMRIQYFILDACHKHFY